MKRTPTHRKELSREKERARLFERLFPFYVISLHKKRPGDGLTVTQRHRKHPISGHLFVRFANPCCLDLSFLCHIMIEGLKNMQDQSKIHLRNTGVEILSILMRRDSLNC